MAWRLMGDSTVWDDLMFPATGINPTGTPTAPTLDNDNGWMRLATDAADTYAAAALFYQYDNHIEIYSMGSGTELVK